MPDRHLFCTLFASSAAVCAAAQARGSKARRAGPRDGDALEEVARCTEADTLLCVTSEGRAFSVPAAKIPVSSSQGSGTAIAQVLGQMANVRMAAMVPLGLPPAPAAGTAKATKAAAAKAAAAEPAAGGEGEEGEEVEGGDGDGHSLLLVTRSGGVKRTAILPSHFHTTARGATVIKVGEEEEVGWAAACAPGDCVLLASSGGQVLVLPTHAIRAAGRTAGAVAGLKPKAGHSMVGMVLVPSEAAQSLKTGDEGGAPGSGSAPQGKAGKGPWLFLVTVQGKGECTNLPCSETSQWPRRFNYGWA